LDVIDEIQPTIAIDLHATYRGHGAFQYYYGAGILEIGHYPIPESTWDQIYRVADSRKPYTIGAFFSNLGRMQKILQGNEGYQLGKAMLDNVRTRGQKAYGGKYQAMLEAPSILSQLVPVDIGRTVMGKIYREAEIAVCPQHLLREYGTFGYTTETFPMAAPYTILQNLAYIEGGLKWVLENW